MEFNSVFILYIFYKTNEKRKKMDQINIILGAFHQFYNNWLHHFRNLFSKNLQCKSHFVFMILFICMANRLEHDTLAGLNL